MTYLFRKIGWGDWWHCNKELYEYFDKHSEYEVRYENTMPI